MGGESRRWEERHGDGMGKYAFKIADMLLSESKSC